MIKQTDTGLYCEAGNFYIDPIKPCSNAIITHAHADHARAGMSNYICTHPTKDIMRLRIGQDIQIKALDYDQEYSLGKAKISLHSAGHILGSAQVKVTVDNKVTVVSGDYKIESDFTCNPFSHVKCDTFISEATFANPRYIWPNFKEEINKIYDWHLINKRNNRLSVLFAYSLGKSQRVINALNSHYKINIYAHDNIRSINKIYSKHGVSNLNTLRINPNKNMTNGLIIMPPGAKKSKLLKDLGMYKTGFCSGWTINSIKEYDIGFQISDHADWNGLISAINKSQAKEVILIHGTGNILKKYLNSKNILISDFTKNNAKESIMQLSMFNE